VLAVRGVFASGSEGEGGRGWGPGVLGALGTVMGFDFTGLLGCTVQGAGCGRFAACICAVVGR
jgi:hypothetical protein